MPVTIILKSHCHHSVYPISQANSTPMTTETKIIVALVLSINILLLFIVVAAFLQKEEVFHLSHRELYSTKIGTS